MISIKHEELARCRAECTRGYFLSVIVVFLVFRLSWSLSIFWFYFFEYSSIKLLILATTRMKHKYYRLNRQLPCNTSK
jgi:hypothetical protein